MVAGALMRVDSTLDALTTMTSSRFTTSSSFFFSFPWVGSWASPGPANAPRPMRARRWHFIPSSLREQILRPQTGPASGAARATPGKLEAPGLAAVDESGAAPGVLRAALHDPTTTHGWNDA